MTKKPLQYLNPRQAFSLDNKYYTQIGRLIFKYSCIEDIISNLFYISLSLSEPLGRLSVRASRPDERLRDFERICKYNGHIYDEDALNTLVKDVGWLKPKRDALAHSKWAEKSAEIISPHDYIIYKTTGGWDKKNQREIGLKTKKLMPQAQLMTFEQILHVVDRSETILDDAVRYFFKFSEENPECMAEYNMHSNISEIKT